MKKSIILASVLAVSVLAAGCGKGADKAESKESSSAVVESSKEETTAETTKAESKVNEDELKVPGYALGEIPEVPVVVLPPLGIDENADAKIKMDATKSLSSVPGITVTPVKVENDRIIRGITSVQVGENGSGQYADGNTTVQTEGDGSGQYIDSEKGITIQRETDGSGQYLDSNKGITLQVEADGSGNYSDDRYGIHLMVDADGTGLYTKSETNLSISVDTQYVIYRDQNMDIEVNGDGSGSYKNKKTGLGIENDGKGKAVITFKGKEKEVDAKPLVFSYKLPLLSAVPAVPAIEANSIMITLDSGVLFDVDKYNIRPDAEETLNNLAKILIEANITDFEIDGHTDSDADDAHNQTLSENRANSVKSYLQSAGVTANITTNGYGESRPVATNETAEGKQLNRRVEIIIPVL